LLLLHQVIVENRQDRVREQERHYEKQRYDENRFLAFAPPHEARGQ
jgi:hypothetical protein